MFFKGGLRGHCATRAEIQIIVGIFYELINFFSSKLFESSIGFYILLYILENSFNKTYFFLFKIIWFHSHFCLSI